MIHQAPYAHKMLEKYDMGSANTALTPLPTNAAREILLAFEDEPILSKEDLYSYIAIVRGVL